MLALVLVLQKLRDRSIDPGVLSTISEIEDEEDDEDFEEDEDPEDDSDDDEEEEECLIPLREDVDDLRLAEGDFELLSCCVNCAGVRSDTKSKSSPQSSPWSSGLALIPQSVEIPSLALSMASKSISSSSILSTRKIQ